MNISTNTDWDVDRANNKGKIGSAAHRFRSILTDAAHGAVAAINGIAGDYLAECNSSLAMDMAFYHDKKPLPMDTESLKSAHPNASSSVVIFVHGLCCNERIWHFSGGGEKTYGSLLQRDLGYTPYYLRYNTGLHVSENGKKLSDLIETLIEAHPVPIKRLVLIGHSKGGLVMRSADHYGQKAGLVWPRLVRKCFYLGSPHLGAALEKAVNALTCGLSLTKWSIAEFTADFLNLRSSAIKDLRFGYTLDEEWKDRNPDAFLQNHRRHARLSSDAHHYLAAGSLSRNPRHPATACFGDLLVRMPSALGDMERSNAWARGVSQVRVFPKANHFALTRHPKVYWQIKDWCEGPLL